MQCYMINNKIKNKKNNIKNIILGCSVCLMFLSCAKYNVQSIESASQKITESLGCVDVKSLTYDSFYELIDSEKQNPNPEDLKKSFNTKIEELKKTTTLDEKQQVVLDEVQKNLNDVIDLMLQDSVKNPNLTWKEQVQKIIQYEMEDQSSEAIIQSQQLVNSKLKHIAVLGQSANLSCQNSQSSQNSQSTTEASTVVENSNNSAAVAGAGGVGLGIKRVFSTAYQSCRVLDLPAMDRNTASVVGIQRLTQKHPDGVGAKRVISDLPSVQKTHYYIRGLASESSCRAVRESPLIYDYGGEPAIKSNTLDFFTNAGTGTNVLGVDCSAFVSSAIAVSGLRYKPGLANKPIYTRQSSSQFIDAKKSGFSCFDNITVTANKSVAVGDIVAVNGHVVAIDSVGVDPFGLKLIKSEAGCSALDYKNFDIVVAQSSPSKNGIGLNKFQIRDYLSETPKMTAAFVGLAKQACLAKFQNKTIKPVDANWGFIRHKGTAECVAPRVGLIGEACTQSCFN